MKHQAWMMKPAATLAYIRQLCCLGLGAQLVIPELLRTLGMVISSGPNVFVGTSANNEPDYVILENFIPSILELFAQELHGAFRRESSAHADWWRRNPGSINRHPETIYRDLYRSDLYHNIWRPLGQHHTLEVQIREHGQLLGHLMLFRAVKEKPFSAHEADELVGLLPYVAHGLRARPNLDGSGTFVGSGHNGHALVDEAGRLSYQCNTAKQLFYLATHPQIHLSTPQPGTSLAALFKKLAGELSAIARGQEASPPVYRMQNPWGRFIFRAYRLEDTLDGHNKLMLITIEHQEPLPLRLLRGLSTLPLSTKEREACFWLAQGHSHTEVAEHLGVQPCTTKQYTDAAYHKLDVHNRTALLQKIMVEAEHAQNSGPAPDCA